MLVTCSSTFLPQRRMFLSEMVDEDEDMLPNQLLDHSDKPENRADAVTIEEFNDEDVQQIHSGGQTASVQVIMLFYFMQIHTFTFTRITENDTSELVQTCLYAYTQHPH